MNLNADADEDITMDSLFTTDPTQTTIRVDDNPDQTTDGQKLFIIDNDHLKEPVFPTADQLFNGPIIKNELPQLNAVFINTSTNNINTTSDLIEVRDAIVQSNGIGREDIELIDSMVPGFISPENKNFYTDEKSKTLLTQTVVSLNTEIDTRVSIVSNGVIEYLDKAVEKYSPVIQTLEQSLMDKITSLQLEVQTLSLSATKETLNLPDGVSLNDVLEFKIDCEEVDSQFNEELKNALINLNSLFVKNTSFVNKLSALFYNQLYSIKSVYYPLGSNSSYLEILDVEPRIRDIDPELEYNPRSNSTRESIYYHTTLSTGPLMVKQLSVLLGFIGVTLASFPTYKNIIQNKMNDSKLNSMEKLKFLQTNSSDNARDGLAILNIVSFFESFIDYLEKLKAVYTALLNNKTA